jgi:large subunit ribosomal protein L32
VIGPLLLHSWGISTLAGSSAELEGWRVCDIYNRLEGPIYVIAAPLPAMAALLRPPVGLIDRVSLSLTPILRPSLYATAPASLARLSTYLPLVGTGNIALRLPNILEDIWESILRAVPKKKTSHRKKRQRFLVGKALKNETALNKCPACGMVKRAHLLCPWCVRGVYLQTRNMILALTLVEIQDMWKGKEPKVTEESK